MLASEVSQLVTENTHIEAEVPICPPSELKLRLPRRDKHVQVVYRGQVEVKNVMDGTDDRIIAIVGPCSIHDPQAAREYAMKLHQLASELKGELLILMRVYFEKPRTNVGWKGLLNDPDLNDTCDIEKGLEVGRNLMLDIVGTGLPIAAEALDVLTPQYIQDLVSWTAIGARTTESPCHRQMCSGFTSAVGFKNGTDGNLDIAVNAIIASGSPSSFLTCSVEGQACIVRTRGNPHCHVVLRGGAAGPNYSAEHIKEAEKVLANAGLPQNLIVDCSHGNSMKDYRKQPAVLNELADQIAAGNQSVIGVMIESNLEEGNQKLGSDPSALKYGVSITDSCLGFEDTAEVLRSFAAKVRPHLAARRRAAASVSGTETSEA